MQQKHWMNLRASTPLHTYTWTSTTSTSEYLLTYIRTFIHTRITVWKRKPRRSWSDKRKAQAKVSHLYKSFLQQLALVDAITGDAWLQTFYSFFTVYIVVVFLDCFCCHRCWHCHCFSNYTDSCCDSNQPGAPVTQHHCNGRSPSHRYPYSRRRRVHAPHTAALMTYFPWYKRCWQHHKNNVQLSTFNCQQQQQ